jgi:hypothetical protein
MELRLLVSLEFQAIVIQTPTGSRINRRLLQP